MTANTKMINIEDLNGEIIPDNASIAIGGVHSHNVPMSVVRQIMRIGSKDLTLIGSISAGLPMDILVGNNQVSRVLSPYVGFEMWGLAPNFRKAVQNGVVEAPDVCEAFPVYSLRAAGNGMSFHPFPPGIHDRSDIATDNKYYRTVADPFTGEMVYAVQAIKPDVAIIHVQKASQSGNCIHLGSVVTDDLMAKAAKTVIVTCDELVEETEIRNNPNQVSISAIYVDYIIPIENGAYPTSSHGLYYYNPDEIKRYLKASKDDKTYNSYLSEIKSLEETTYLEKYVEKAELHSKLEQTESGYTVEELIAVVFARDIKDNEVGICGAVSAIPMAAMQLAERMHAPDMKWIAGGSGYVNPRGKLVPSSTDYRMSIGAETRLSMNEVIPLEMNEIDFFFAGGLQIDSQGNTNLAGIPSESGWKFRGPGSVGLAFLPRAGRVYLYTLTHNSRTLVEEVSYTSGPGHGDLENKFGDGPSLLVTNLCVFVWDNNEDMWRLKSLHPGTDLVTVQENTGFDFAVSDDLGTTLPPTEEEMRKLRNIDPIGYLRGVMD